MSTFSTPPGLIYEDADVERLLSAVDEDIDEIDDLFELGGDDDEMRGVLDNFPEIRAAKKNRSAKRRSGPPRADRRKRVKVVLDPDSATTVSRVSGSGSVSVSGYRDDFGGALDNFPEIRAAKKNRSAKRRSGPPRADRRKRVKVVLDPDSATTVSRVSGSGLQPIFEPRHNFREVGKQLWLLEDHLQHPARRCNDCIRKHLLAAEALADEAAAIDKMGAHIEEAHALAGAIRGLARDVSSGLDQNQVAQRVRQIRKRLVKRHFGAIDEESIGGALSALSSSSESSTTADVDPDEDDSDEVEEAATLLPTVPTSSDVEDGAAMLLSVKDNVRQYAPTGTLKIASSDVVKITAETGQSAATALRLIEQVNAALELAGKQPQSGDWQWLVVGGAVAATLAFALVKKIGKRQASKRQIKALAKKLGQPEVVENPGYMVTLLKMTPSERKSLGRRLQKVVDGAWYATDNMRIRAARKLRMVGAVEVFDLVMQAQAESAAANAQKSADKATADEQARKAELLSKIQGDKYGEVKRRYARVVMAAAEEGDVERAQKLRVHARRRLGELRGRMLVQRHFGAMVSPANVTWSTSKGREVAAKLFLQAAREDPTHSSGFEDLASRVKNGSLYHDLSSPTQMMADVVYRTKSFAPETSAEAQQLYESALEAEEQGRVTVEQPDLSEIWSGNEVVIYAWRKSYPNGPIEGWYRGTVVPPRQGQKVDGSPVKHLPDQGWLPVFYADSQDSSGVGSHWVPMSDVVRVKDNPISGDLRGKGFKLYRSNGNIEGFRFTDARLAMADLIESVVLDQVGDVCEISRVPGCSDLSQDRRNRIAEKIVWAALVNATYESMLNPAAVGKAGELGLFQLHTKWLGNSLKGGQKFDPVLNTKIIVGELKRVFNGTKQRGDRFLRLMQREVASPTVATSPSLMEWADAFTIEVEAPYDGVRAGRLRARTIADFFGVSQHWPIPGEAPSTLPFPAPTALPIPAPTALPSAPSPQQAGLLGSLFSDGWQKPTMLASGLLLGALAVRAAVEAYSVPDRG